MGNLKGSSSAFWLTHPLVHFQPQREQNGDTTTVSHPYVEQIRLLLEHPPQPLKFSRASEPLSMEGPYTWIDKRSELEAPSQFIMSGACFRC